jgi:hypothetical protein
MEYVFFIRPRSRIDQNLGPAVETEYTQGLTNEEFNGLRSNLRKSI